VTPVASPSDVDGTGTIPGLHGGQAEFDLGVSLHKSKKKMKISGNVIFNDPSSNISFRSTNITTLTFNDNHQAHIAGSGKLGKTNVSFAVDVVDNGSPGINDLFSIHLSNGYSNSGSPLTGDISIR
jgi:hypothetical protein